MIDRIHSHGAQIYERTTEQSILHGSILRMEGIFAVDLYAF